MVEDCKYAPWNFCGECGQGFVGGVDFWKPISLLADVHVAWQPALETNLLIIVSFILSTFPLSVCICSMAVSFAIGVLTLVAISASTCSTTSTAATVSTAPMALPTVAAILGKQWLLWMHLQVTW